MMKSHYRELLDPCAVYISAADYQLHAAGVCAQDSAQHCRTPLGCVVVSHTAPGGPGLLDTGALLCAVNV
jgi:hypothetical protein